MKRVFIIHGWAGSPNTGWKPWLKNELEKRNFFVSVPAMPDPKHPKIDTWVPFLKKVVGKSDGDTYFVGHSMGCQTILRYIESLQKDEKVGGAVLVAGFTHLTDEAYEDEEDPLIAKPWLETKINWKTILKHTKKFTAIFSDNDPYVPLTDTKIFKKNLGAKIIIEHDKKHFSGDDGITELPVTLDELLKMAKK